MIQINGAKTDNGFYVDPVLAGNKFMVVSGSLQLYGSPPATTTTYLTQTVLSGSDTISVASKTDWKVGDTLVIAASFTSRT